MSCRGAVVAVSSIVSAAPERVWARVTTPEGINAELRPWLRMTVPRAMGGRTIDDVAVGESLGRSWLLLFGVLPIEYDDIGVAELEPGHRFLERSSMLTMELWEHERTVQAAGEGAARVSDRLCLRLRRPLAALPGAEGLATRIVSTVFRHRHRRLQAHFQGR